MRLNELRDNPGATQPRKRVGRGAGSGTGKRAGRGDKGQKSRSGVALKGFEGGQMPIHRRLPKRGFKNPFSKDYNEVNLGRIQSAIDKGRLDANLPVTADVLLSAGIIRRVKDGVRLLGSGELKTKVAFEVTGASENAIKAVEGVGGSVTLVPIVKPKAKAVKVDAKRAKAKTEPKKKKSGKSAEKSEK